MDPYIFRQQRLIWAHIIILNYASWWSTLKMSASYLDCMKHIWVEAEEPSLATSKKLQ